MSKNSINDSKLKDYVVRVQPNSVLRFFDTAHRLGLQNTMAIHSSDTGNGVMLLVVTTTPEMITNLGLSVECSIEEITGEIKKR